MRHRAIAAAVTLAALPWFATLACSSDESTGGSGASAGGAGGSSGGAGGVAGSDGGSDQGGSDGGSAGTAIGGNGGGSDPGDAGPDAACDGIVYPLDNVCRSRGDARDLCIKDALKYQPNRRADRPDCDVGCFCSRCLETFSTCGADDACRAILLCAAETGCTGIDCYNPATCQTVIDDAGGVTSDSGSLAVDFMNCQQAQGCAPTCPDAGVGSDAGTSADASAGDGG
jgi:hypothetical protein